MKSLYIVFECNSQRSTDSVVIKLITPNRQKAEGMFNSCKEGYEDQDYYLNVCEYTPVIHPECDNDVINEFEVPYLTTEL